MDKNTIIAIVLSVIVITVAMTIQTTFFAPSPVTTDASLTENVVSANDLSSSPELLRASADMAWNSGLPGSFSCVGDQSKSQQFEYQTDVFQITFDPTGASVSSIKLKDHLDDGQPVELLFKGPEDNNAFLMYAGDDRTNPINAVFNYEMRGNEVIFSQTFAPVSEDGSLSDETFTITKTYNFGQKEYLFEIKVDIANSVNKSIPLSYDNFAYTLAFEPQIGPAFDEMPNNNYNYRRFYIQADGGKKATPKISNGQYRTSDYLTWAALCGKYFSLIGIPDATRYTTTLTESTSGDIALASKMYFSRPAVRSASNTDTFRFYCGPQIKNQMTIYNESAMNGFGLANLHLEKALDSSSWLGWLENVLKWILQLFYKLIPNYGVAIILLTIFIKLILYPLTKKSMDSTAKMSMLGPKMEEMKVKYKDNPQKQNEEMAKLYKEEKINPLGGCLPMLLQFPIFIALYGLLNKHFELRGAMFIPGWIPDLSVPDTVFTFPFNIPFLGNGLHILPIIYTASMIYSMKITQTGGTPQTNGTMKFMTWGMPIIFFFVLYDAPSGLLLYWTVMNFLSIAQQYYMNKKKQKEAVGGVPAKTSNVSKFPQPKNQKGKKK